MKNLHKIKSAKEYTERQKAHIYYYHQYNREAEIYIDPTGRITSSDYKFWDNPAENKAVMNIYKGAIDKTLSKDIAVHEKSA